MHEVVTLEGWSSPIVEAVTRTRFATMRLDEDAAGWLPGRGDFQERGCDHRAAQRAEHLVPSPMTMPPATRSWRSPSRRAASCR